ncbi:MAG TPA: FeoB-associated Cys-rich membrane protein [Tetragenococcus sp.]|nr:FeoB-associated Cys-rich membrane protein [Tetragenococcus sp.]
MSTFILAVIIFGFCGWAIYRQIKGHGHCEDCDCGCAVKQEQRVKK